MNKVDFNVLFSKYFSRIYRFALGLTHDKVEAEEVAQETFFKVLMSIDKFEGRSDPTTWLCRIVKNVYLNEIRRKRREVYLNEIYKQGGEEELPDKNTLMLCQQQTELLDVLSKKQERKEREKMKMRLLMEVHKLSEPYREVFILRVFGELRHAQIATIVQKTESNVRVIFNRAVKTIRERTETN